MDFVYHLVPPRFSGALLHPLNVLRELNRPLHDEHAAKYVGREAVRSYIVTPLGCLWNDVIHSSAVDPRRLKLAYETAAGKRVKQWDFFEIPLSKMDRNNITIYRGSSMGQPSEEDFVPLDEISFERAKIVPEKTLQYWREIIGSGRKPLLFLGIHHILFRGSINVSDCRRIKV